MFQVIDTETRKPKRSSSVSGGFGKTGLIVDKPQRIIRDPEFARRLETACDAHPHAPEKHFGRIRWLQEQLMKLAEEVSPETVRKWLAGEARPRVVKMEKLAQALQVDPAWLAMGIDPVLQPRERRARNAMADGAVNVVAGFIQMDGGYPAFPEEKDRKAQENAVDLIAIIKGASYNFHVTLGERDGREATFVVPSRRGENVVVLGVVRDTAFRIQVYELTSDLINTIGENRGGSIEIVADISELRKVDNFRDRL
jgi:transcriptional regulator with XRE-family HTH domain